MKKNFYRNLACMLIFTGGLCIATSTKAQVTVGSKGIPNAGALLDMKQKDKTDGSANSDKGLGLPRVALSAVDKLDPCVATTGNATKDDTAKKSHIGLTVYNITDNTSTDATLIEGVYAWDGTMWTQYSGAPAGGAENGLSMNGRKVILGGPLNQPTTITGDATNGLTLEAPTTIDETLTVTGTTNLKGANINGNLVVTGNKAIKYVDGNQSLGNILTSDASGNATWQAPGIMYYQELAAFKAFLPIAPSVYYYYTGYSISLPTAGLYMVNFGGVFWQLVSHSVLQDNLIFRLTLSATPPPAQAGDWVPSSNNVQGGIEYIPQDRFMYGTNQYNSYISVRINMAQTIKVTAPTTLYLHLRINSTQALNPELSISSGGSVLKVN